MTDRRWISSAGPRQYGTSKIRTSPPTSAASWPGAVRRWSAASARCRTGPAAARTCRRPRPCRAPRSGRPSGSRPRVVHASRTAGSPARFGLPGPERDRAAVGHQQRVEGVDEVRRRRSPSRGRGRAVRARSSDVDEGVVLAPRELEVDRVQEPVGRIVEGARRTPGRAASRARRAAARTCSARRSAGSWRSPDEDSRRSSGGRCAAPRPGTMVLLDRRGAEGYPVPVTSYAVTAGSSPSARTCATGMVDAVPNAEATSRRDRRRDGPGGMPPSLDDLTGS